MCRYVILILGNIYNKAYRSILGNIMMSNDGRICFFVVPDKKYYGKYNFSDFMAAVLQNIHKDECSTSDQISP